MSPEGQSREVFFRRAAVMTNSAGPNMSRRDRNSSRGPRRLRSPEVLSSRLSKYLPLAPLPRTTKLVISDVHESKGKLIESLLASQTPKGWPDPSGQDTQSLWTAIEICTSLLQVRRCPNNFDSVIDNVIQTQVLIDNYVGWEYEGLPGHISVFVTGDVLRMFIATGRFDKARELIETLFWLQHPSGGWGVCDGDAADRVRATSWATRVLATCLAFPPLRAAIKLERLRDASTWLYGARNSAKGDFGWGNQPNAHPSNVSATAHALSALLEIARQQQTLGGTNSSLQLPVRLDTLKESVNWLKQAQVNGTWTGTIEDFVITIDGRAIGRHTSGGVGSTLVLQVLVDSVELEVIDVKDYSTFVCVSDIVHRTAPYQTVPGNWLVPADDGGEPLAWNSALALDAYSLFERFYIRRILPHYLEHSVYDGVMGSARLWQRTSFVLFTALLGVFLAPHVRALGQVPSLFAQLPVLYQGLIMIGVGFVAQQLYDKLGRLWTRLTHRGE